MKRAQHMQPVLLHMPACPGPVLPACVCVGSATYLACMHTQASTLQSRSIQKVEAGASCLAWHPLPLPLLTAPAARRVHQRGPAGTSYMPAWHDAC